MSNVVKISSNSNSQGRRFEVATGWLSKIDRGLDETELKNLQAWLGEDSQNIDTFLNLANLWDQMDSLAELSSMLPISEYCISDSHKTYNQFVFASVVVLILSIFVSLFLYTGKDSNFNNSQLEYAFYETDIGESDLIQLLDGSIIKLNTSSLVKINYSTDERKIILERGEANFDVAKDSLRPFRVYTDNNIVEAVGTSFNIQKDNSGSIEVIVTEGEINLIKINNPNFDIQSTNYDDISVVNTMSVIAGEMINISSETQSPAGIQLIDQDGLAVKLSWHDGMLLFRDEALSEVLVEMGRYSSTLIEADESIRNIRVTGYFNAGDIDGLLVAMQKNFGINAQHLALDHIVLTPQ